MSYACLGAKAFPPTRNNNFAHALVYCKNAYNFQLECQDRQNNIFFILDTIIKKNLILTHYSLVCFKKQLVQKFIRQILKLFHFILIIIIFREEEAERLKSVLGEEILREGKQGQLDPLLTTLARLVHYNGTINLMKKYEERKITKATKIRAKKFLRHFTFNTIFVRHPVSYTKFHSNFHVCHQKGTCSSLYLYLLIHIFCLYE